MIKNVIFDIGNVLMGFAADDYGRTYFTDPQLAQTLQQAINEFHLWNKVDLGIEPVEEVIDKFAATLPEIETKARQAIYASIDYVKRADYAIPWQQELHQAGFKTYYLSNLNNYFIDKRPEILDFIPYMDGGILSCSVHLIKPDPAFYQLLCQRYHLQPQECVFLDDRPDNIQAAQNLGMQVILVQSYEQAHQALKELLNY